MTIFGTCGGQQSARVIDTPESRCHGQIKAGSPAKQSVNGFELAMYARHPTVGIRSVIAEQIDQRNLDSAFTRYAPSANQPECLTQNRPVVLCARVQNHLGNFHDIRGQFPVPNRILRYKFQQRRILKVVAACKNHTLVHEVRMRDQVSPKSPQVSGVQQIDGASKRRVLNALLEWKTQVVRRCRFLDAPLQFWPARKTPFASNR